jgi:hypothetical protein
MLGESNLPALKNFDEVVLAIGKQWSGTQRSVTPTTSCLVISVIGSFERLNLIASKH